MNISVMHYSPAFQIDKIQDHTIVVIDLFRATSVIVTALSYGAKRVYVTTHVEEALELAKQFNCNEYILGGERHAKTIPGFQLGNSPIHYTTEVVKQKNVILTTTNGTKAVQFCKSAKALYVCALLNCRTVAIELARQTNDLIIMCAATKHLFALEDAFCAGMLIFEIEKITSIKVDDFGIAVKSLYTNHDANRKNFLAHANGFKSLVNNGYKHDIDFCLQKNIYASAPKLVNYQYFI